MSNRLNFLSSVSPAFNVGQEAARGGGLFQGLGSIGGGAARPAVGSEGVLRGPLAGPQPTQFRQPTQKYERGIFGNQMRPTTEREDRQYQREWRSDRRNQGYGRGQVDPGLARAANKKDDENKSGGK